ncbi:MAG: hypothetical protein AAGC55_03105, partial [Myxococcota bacterium]
SEAETAVRVLSRNLDVYDDLVEAGRQHDTIQRDANKYMSSAVGRQKAAIAKLKETIEGVFTPETIEGFAVALEAAVKWAGQLLDTFLEVAEAIGPLRDAADALANSLADATGLNASIEAKSAAPQLLSQQAEAFGRGEVDPKLKRMLSRYKGADDAQVEGAAARLIVRDAERAGLISGGKVREKTAMAAFLRAQGASPENATAAQRDVAADRVRGLERALDVDVKVDVKVDGDAVAKAAAKTTERATVRRARSG